MSTLARPAETIREEAAIGAPAEPPGLFPLAATPFERYMAADQRPGYPMSISIEALLRGEVDPERLERAIGDAVRANPLLMARLVGADWRFGGHQRPRFDDPTPAAAIDLSSDIPLRVGWRPNADGGVLELTVHHAVCDGLGVIGFFGDTVAAYNGENLGAADSAAVEALRRRGRVDRSGLPAVSAWRANRYFAGELWRFATTRPVALRSEKAEPGRARLRTIRLDRELVAATSRSLQSRGASLNTGLLACAFSAAASAEVVRGRGSVVRVTAPFSLRGAADRGLTAANKIGYAFLDRRLGEAGDPAGLVDRLQRDVDAIQTWKLAAGFSDAVGRVAAVPAGLWAATRLARRFSTMVLSNVGDPRRRRRRGPRATSGGLRLEAVRGAPPVRPGTSLAVTATTYAGGLLLTHQRDPATLTEADADTLLRSLGEGCQRLAGVATGLGEVTDGFPE